LTTRTCKQREYKTTKYKIKNVRFKEVFEFFVTEKALIIKGRYINHTSFTRKEI